MVVFLGRYMIGVSYGGVDQSRASKHVATNREPRFPTKMLIPKRVTIQAILG